MRVACNLRILQSSLRTEVWLGLTFGTPPRRPSDVLSRVAVERVPMWTPDLSWSHLCSQRDINGLIIIIKLARRNVNQDAAASWKLRRRSRFITLDIIGPFPFSRLSDSTIFACLRPRRGAGMLVAAKSRLLHRGVQLYLQPLRVGTWVYTRGVWSRSLSHARSHTR